MEAKILRIFLKYCTIAMISVIHFICQWFNVVANWLIMAIYFDKFILLSSESMLFHI